MSQAPSRGQAYRFFAEDLRGDEIALSEGEAHHALHVLRLKAGAEAELFDGRGGSAAGRIVRAGRSGVVVAVQRRREAQPREQPAVHLAFAVPKGKRLDWLLEKATELGAASLRPIVFARSVAGGAELGEGKRPRWLSHCIAAAKQCGLNWLPELAEPAPLETFLDARGEWLCLLGSAETGAVSVAEALARKPHEEVCLLVGPEGGLTDAEREAVAEAGFVPTRLGRTTLRVETAAVGLLAAVVAGRS